MATADIVRPLCEVIPDSAIHGAALAFGSSTVTRSGGPLFLWHGFAGQAALTCLTIEVALVDFDRA